MRTLLILIQLELLPLLKLLHCQLGRLMLMLEAEVVGSMLVLLLTVLLLHLSHEHS
jgi:hypothetical protein